MLRILSLALILLLSAAAETLAQSGNDFIIASELLREGEYEEAYEILERLLEENPDSYPIFERSVSALVSMKRFDEAIALSQKRLNDNYRDLVSAAKLGELYHTAGDTARAREVWNKTLEFNEGNLQAYRHIANTMNERRDHAGALRVYLQARDRFNQAELFSNEIANNYLVTGNYEEALREYLSLIAANKDFSFQVQRQLMRFDEPYLFDVAILETEDKLTEYRNDSAEADTFREFLIWLYMERGLHRRALTTARALESSSRETKYAVFQLGDRLRTQNEFELAESAYSYYTGSERHEMEARSLEQLARVYMGWAAYLQNNNLDFGQKTDSLYIKAQTTLETLNDNHPRFDRRNNALLLQAELALDYLKDVDQASRYHERLLALPSTRDNIKPQADYIEGRIHLFNQDYNRARIAFTQSNKAVRIGNLADKTRYYLALSDFYSGDYDFARIQLRALERQNTSFFANNALQLRLWIQEGVNADSTTNQLDSFSKASFYHHVIGEPDKAMQALAPLLSEHANHPLNGEAVLLASSIVRYKNASAAYHLLNLTSGTARSSQTQYATLNPVSMERIFWERARLADHVYFNQSTRLAELPELSHIPEELTYDRESPQLETLDEVITAYEDLLMDYPQGFYADQARARIRELSSLAN